MYNGQTNGTSSFYTNNIDSSIASLRNFGNTCFLNSILYTLRYTPNFLRNLHHLVDDLHNVQMSLGQTKYKSASLGRNISGLSGSSSRSNSSKDLLSLGTNKTDIKVDLHVSQSIEIIQTLHELYKDMHMVEVQENSHTPITPKAFKTAFVTKYKIFSGNQQQDAHEFLICLLNTLKDVCQMLAKNVKEYSEREISNSKKIIEKSKPKEISKYFLRSKNNKKNSSKDSGSREWSADDSSKVTETNVDYTKFARKCSEFMEMDFEGVSVTSTKCLECEEKTERREILTNLCVPVNESERQYDNDLQKNNDKIMQKNDNVIIKEKCVTSEFLKDDNKYYCENCFRYNEALRQVGYIQLPNVLVIQLKRFQSSTTDGTVKISQYFPTPLEFDCFCQKCNDILIKSKETTVDRYELYSVIMHKGASMAEGHYVSLVRVDLISNKSEFSQCEKDNNLFNATTNHQTDKSNNRLFNFKKKLSSLDAGNHLNDFSCNNKFSQQFQLCPGYRCCSTKFNGSNVFNDFKKLSLNNIHNQGVWLECNDETIRELSFREFQQQLEDNDLSTPYLLFYVKVKKDRNIID